MAKEICISSTPHETRLAILEDDQLAEIYYERENEYTLAGSVYNGRVTRVLPGMQSAFVDVGLERDAFLYVTDFLELEDQEETDELEKAAVSGANQPPREVRHTAASDSNSGRGGRSSQKSDQKPEQKQEPRPAQERVASEKPPKDRHLSVEALPEAESASMPASGTLSLSEQAGGGEEDPGAKRWRGRRRRRGGRGASASHEGQPTQGDETSAPYVEEITESEAEVAPRIQAAAGDRSAAQRRATAGDPGERPSASEWSSEPTTRFERASAASPAPFVMPGESLSKYGGAPADSSPAEDAASPAAPVRPRSTFKPATMIVSPIEWDGSGPLPGESLSRHRNVPAEPVEHEQAKPAAEAMSEPQGVFSDAPESGSPAPDSIEEEDFVEEREAEPEEFAPDAEEDELVEEELVEEDLLEEELTPDVIDETDGAAPEPPLAEIAPEAAVPAETDDYAIKTPIDEPSTDEPVASPVTRQDEVVAETAHDEPPVHESIGESIGESIADEPDPDAAASHNVDPLPPSGFRLFGLGGKKKKEEEEAAKTAARIAAVTSVPAYAPGSGLIVEETIEEEEFDAPRHSNRAKGGDHELDDFEEETLPAQMRSGDLGEMFQEAHLDHRILLNLDSKNGDEEDDDDEDEPTAEGQSASGASSQQSRDRAARGRRGRGVPPAGGQAGKGRGPSRRSMQLSDLPIISDLLKPGQEILVQIAKEPIAKKGARITSHIALPGRFLVFMPTVSHIGVSRKIESDAERQRLKRILVHERGEASGGFIVRTAAEGASEEELRADLRMLLNLWAEIKKRSDESKSPALIYHDLGLIERILRDQVSSNFSSIWVDSAADYERIVRFLNRFSPSLVRRVKLYTKETPLFEHFGIQDEISKALRSKVWLKSGGSIVINQTEALVAIDINTGKYVGKSARLEDTIVKTNLDAVPEIVRQIRLRDLGGIIVIDFIDMDDRKNRFRVMAALEEALKSDRAPTKVLQFNDFGLVAITRKRVKQSLERTLSVPCPTCQATGMVKSPTTVCNEIYTELRKMKKHFEGADVLLRVNPETVKTLKSNNASWLTEFEELVGKNILVKSDATLHPEQFDIQG
ncbi:MAG: Rne/Rng family ribonuclease [Terracidiphilus sp.]